MPPIKIRDIQSGAQNIEVVGRVVDMNERKRVTTKFGPADLVKGTLKDETGSICINLWRHQIDQVKEGELVKIINGFTKIYNDRIELSIGKNGMIIPAEGEKDRSIFTSFIHKKSISNFLPLLIIPIIGIIGLLIVKWPKYFFTFLIAIFWYNAEKSREAFTPTLTAPGIACTIAFFIYWPKSLWILLAIIIVFFILISLRGKKKRK